MNNNKQKVHDKTQKVSITKKPNKINVKSTTNSVVSKSIIDEFSDTFSNIDWEPSGVHMSARGEEKNSIQIGLVSRDNSNLNQRTRDLITIDKSSKNVIDKTTANSKSTINNIYYIEMMLILRDLDFFIKDLVLIPSFYSFLTSNKQFSSSVMQVVSDYKQTVSSEQLLKSMVLTANLYRCEKGGSDVSFAFELMIELKESRINFKPNLPQTYKEFITNKANLTFTTHGLSALLEDPTSYVSDYMKSSSNFKRLILNLVLDGSSLPDHSDFLVDVTTGKKFLIYDVDKYGVLKLLVYNLTQSTTVENAAKVLDILDSDNAYINTLLSEISQESFNDYFSHYDEEYSKLVTKHEAEVDEKLASISKQLISAYELQIILSICDSSAHNSNVISVELAKLNDATCVKAENVYEDSKNIDTLGNLTQSNIANHFKDQMSNMVFKSELSKDMIKDVFVSSKSSNNNMTLDNDKDTTSTQTFKHYNQIDEYKSEADENITQSATVNETITKNSNDKIIRKNKNLQKKKGDKKEYYDVIKVSDGMTDLKNMSCYRTARCNYEIQVNKNELSWKYTLLEAPDDEQFKIDFSKSYVGSLIPPYTKSTILDITSHVNSAKRFLISQEFRRVRALVYNIKKLDIPNVVNEWDYRHYTHTNNLMAFIPGKVGLSLNVCDNATSVSDCLVKIQSILDL